MAQRTVDEMRQEADVLRARVSRLPVDDPVRERAEARADGWDQTAETVSALKATDSAMTMLRRALLSTKKR